jgi:hypothetical protein
VGCEAGPRSEDGDFKGGEDRVKISKTEHAIPTLSIRKLG